MSSKEYNSLVNRIDAARVEIEARVNADAKTIQNLKDESSTRGLKINSLMAENASLLAKNDACAEMREDLKKKVEGYKSELIKSNTTNEELKDQNKKLQRSLEKCNDELKDRGAKMSELAAWRDSVVYSNVSLLEAVKAAMAEMRKVNRGKPSHNKSRAFQILETAVAKTKTEVPATNEA
jgi:chromosome segregation ATPase